MKRENNAIIVTSIISGVILIIAILAILTMSGNSTDNRVNVDGIATVKAMPDLVGVYFNIESKADTSIEAKDKTSEVLNKLVDELMEKEGLSRDEIVTENFNLYPNYEWDGNGKRTEKGYIATHAVTVKIPANETEKVGRIVDIGVDAGALVSYINFELTQESQNKYKAKAMKLAAQDARIKAESVAVGFNKKVGDLISVNVNDFSYYPWNVYSASGMAEDSVALKESLSNIQPGEKEVTARVSATYELK